MKVAVAATATTVGVDADDSLSLLLRRGGDERSFSCFRRSNRWAIVVPTRGESRNEATGGEKREEKRKSARRVFFFTSSLEVFFDRFDRLFISRSRSPNPLSLPRPPANSPQMAAANLPALPNHLVLRRLQKADFDKGNCCFLFSFCSLPSSSSIDGSDR